MTPLAVLGHVRHPVLAAPDLVQAVVRRHPEEERLEARGAPIAAGMSVQLHEDVLGQLLGLPCVLDEAMGEARHRPVVPVVERCEGGGVSSRHPLHQCRVLVRRFVHGHWM